VSAGESLYRIAQKYGITVDELLRLNSLKKNQAIYPGQKLLVAPAEK
jgi:LysM repeat protein